MGFPVYTADFVGSLIDFTIPSQRLPLSFTQRYGAGLPDFVFIQVPSSTSTSMRGVELVRARDGGIYMGGRWKEFKEYYDIHSGHSLVFEFLPKYKLIAVSIYDGTATEKDFHKPKGKEIVVVEDYHQVDSSTSIWIDEHGSMRQETKRKRLESDDSVSCTVSTSARGLELGGGKAIFVLKL